MHNTLLLHHIYIHSIVSHSFIIHDFPFLWIIYFCAMRWCFSVAFLMTIEIAHIWRLWMACRRELHCIKCALNIVSFTFVWWRFSFFFFVHLDRSIKLGRMLCNNRKSRRIFKYAINPCSPLSIHQFFLHLQFIFRWLSFFYVASTSPCSTHLLIEQSTLKMASFLDQKSSFLIG